MKGKLLAGAIATAAAMVTGPVFAQGPALSPGATASPQAEPTPRREPVQPAPAQPEEEGASMRAGGEWAMHSGPMMRHEMWRHEMTRWNPQRRCIDRLAWRAARQAYVETELNLTQEQRPLWDKLQSIAQSEQQRERQLCDQLKPPGQLTMLDRLDRTQQFLSARLNALQAAKPAVQALYESLSPEQKEIFDHPFRPD